MIRRNLVFSLLYNLAGVGLAMAGLLDPIGAAILMPLSSLTVIDQLLSRADLRCLRRTPDRDGRP